MQQSFIYDVQLQKKNYILKQGKSDGFDSCDQPSNFA